MRPNSVAFALFRFEVARISSDLSWGACNFIFSGLVNKSKPDVAPRLRCSRMLIPADTFFHVETSKSMNTQSVYQLVSLHKAAARLDISIRALYRLMASGEIPRPVKVGRSSKLCESDIQLYLESLKSRRL